MKIICGVFLFVSLLSSRTLSAQGCSDAGVCTIHSIKNNAEANHSSEGRRNEIIIGFGFGKGENSTNNYSGYFEYTRNLTKKLYVSGRVNYAAINGELANTSGPGDLFFSITHTFNVKRKWQKSFTAGLKIPFNGADRMKNNIFLPMPYQTSLGTSDLLLALNYNRKSVGASIAFQQPLNSINQNKFLVSDYPPNHPAINYQSTNEFSRKADLVGKMCYSFKTGERFSARPGLLIIYHTANDTYLDENKSRRTINNSRGLTLNGIFFVDYRLKNRGGFELSFGTPFLTREQRPDGLTRKFITSLEYKFSF